MRACRGVLAGARTSLSPDTAVHHLTLQRKGV